jgi:hypothetical protein
MINIVLFVVVLALLMRLARARPYFLALPQKVGKEV